MMDTSPTLGRRLVRAVALTALAATTAGLVTATSAFAGPLTEPHADGCRVVNAHVVCITTPASVVGPAVIGPSPVGVGFPVPLPCGANGPRLACEADLPGSETGLPGYTVPSH